MVDYAGVVLVAVLLAEALFRVFASGVWRRSRLVRAPRLASLELFAALIPTVLGLVAASMVYSAMAYGGRFRAAGNLQVQEEEARPALRTLGLGGAGFDGRLLPWGSQCLLSAALYSPTLYAEALPAGRGGGVARRL